MKHYPLLAVFLAGLTVASKAQQADTVATDEKSNRVVFSGYVEPYYVFDFGQPQSGSRPGFLYSHNRHNEFNINLGFLKCSLNLSRVRANAALAAGTYMNANYAAEEGVARNILEMNAGIKLLTKQDLWLDAGIFPSHIGFESAISKDCRSLTRSMMAENSPYFESGIRLIYTAPSGHWFFSGLALNGWQRIRRVDGNSLLSFGSQIQFKPNDRISLNSSTFIGTDKPDDKRLMRYFHNFYAILTLTRRLEATLAFDTGLEESTPKGDEHNSWWSAVGMLRYAFSEKLATTARGEYFRYPDNVIINSEGYKDFSVAGLSLNVDYSIHPQAMIRLEGKWLLSSEASFLDFDQSPVTKNFSLTGAIAVSF